MKWKLFFFLVTPLLIGACHAVSTSIPMTKKSTKEDDSTGVNNIHSDSIDKIIMQASDIRLYQMEGFFSDSIKEKKDTLFSYYIKKDYGKLKKNEKELFYFVLGDGRSYQKNYAPIKQPFRPNFTLVFLKGKQKVYFFTSLGTGEIAISDEKANFSFYHIKNVDFIDRWYDYVITKRNPINK